MADTTPAPRVPTPAEQQDDFVTQLVDKIVDTIGKVRENTVDRVDKVARYIVYGLFLGILGVFAAVAGTVLLVRTLVILTDVVFGIGDPNPRHEVWLAHLLVGVLFCLGGAIAWKKRPDLDV